MTIHSRRFHAARFLVPALALLSLNACSVMVGNIKPVEEKSEFYGIMDLAKTNPEWVKLSAEEAGMEPETSKEASSTEISDVAYQARKTASIISVNSACRAAEERDEKDLKTMTQVLFMGLTDLTVRSEKQILIQGSPALESTVQGKLHGEEMVLRAVVFRRTHCVYDLVYMAKPAHFEQNEQDFAHFVASLRLK